MLDVVTYIQRQLDPTLAYRFACRVGMCGSCAMTVNGVPRWTCRTHVDKVARDERARDRAAAQPAGDPRPRHRHARVLRQVGARRGSSSGNATRHDDFALVAPDRRAARRRRRHRMHRLRRLLQRLRRGGVEPGLPRPGGAQPRLDAGERRARREQARAPARGGGRRRLPFLPHPHELHRALPEADLAHRARSPV